MRASHRNVVLPTLLPTLLVLSGCAGQVRADPAPAALPRTRPEAQGISSAAILGFVDAADRQIDSLHGFMLVRHGQVAAEDTYVAKLCFYETPFCLTMKLQFAGDKLSFDAERNVAFGPTRQPRLEGCIP